MQAATITLVALALSGTTMFAPAPAPPAEGEQPAEGGEEAPAEGEQPPAEGEHPPAEGEQPPAEGEQPPTQEEAPKPRPSAAPLVDPAEIARLQEEARGVRDELFKARARVSSVTSKLFRSKVTVELRSNIERFYEVSDFSITIDGAPVYFKEKGLAPVKSTIVEMYAAPGSHQMGVSAKLKAKRQSTYQVAITQEFTIVVPEDSRLDTRVMLHELGNMFGKFDKRKKGKYRVHTELHAKAKANKKKKGKARVTATGKASVGK